ncbi:MAG TPA: TraR/DksA C4-type zinc finger protein [Acidimicrobiales bacterium]|nr:TraR/DksA C4-type zinc finger protein [Acidimicrobiales bacterium]
MTNEAAAVDYRALLEEERRSLLEQLHELGFGDSGPGLTYDPNFADSSQVTAERGEAEALAAELRGALEDVDAALARIENGTYGICERCGKPIDPARLEAMPTVRTCIECASAHR